ncbi:uncharacterized protein LOC143918592 [Arctopsyche grandis]|uniref:uncharacterized protein LOC143918592 n=1 Tax=Arctopsyche grandis TaxID=121162 RepID=UPI00406D8035
MITDFQSPATMTTTPEKTWNKFFLDAHLPSEISATYALKFTENRIQMNMLLDLNKDYLKEMDITCTGDVISILRHAKRVHEEASRDRVLGMASPKIPIATVAARMEQQKNSTTTPRIPNSKSRNSVVIKQSSIVETNTIKERLGEIRSKATKRKIHPPIITDLEAESEAFPVNESFVSKLKRISLQQGDVHNLQTATLNKEKEESMRGSTNVFTRLGSSEETGYSHPEISVKQQQSSAMQKNVFARLGGFKGPDIPLTKTIINSNELLEQKNVFKEAVPKKIVIKTNGKVRSLSNVPSSGSMRADKVPLNIKQRLPVSNTQRKSVKFSPHVDFKVIEKRSKNSLIQKSLVPSVLTHIKTTPTRDVMKISVPSIKNNNVKSRLGNFVPRRSNNMKEIRVFDRLGLTSRHTVL